MKIYTIGFTKRSAESFFSALEASGAQTLIDVRLNNVSQLAGFSKKNDLQYFVGRICGMRYRHLTELAPTKEMLQAYQANGHWDDYAKNFLALMAQRRIEDLDRAMLDGACLLCSEDKPHHCHRRLVAEYLDDKWGGVEIEHL
ncbi:MAG: hypothetical protein JWP36_1223 [Paucimonas sp.]|nr:hypothetical protein [Paucimonas sp.]